MPARESLWVTVTEQQQQQQHYFVQVKHYYFLLLLPILISHTPLLFLVKPSIKAFEKRERQPFSTIRQSISATATEREKEENRTRKHWNWKEKWKKVKLNAAAAAVSSGERVTVECLLSVCLLVSNRNWAQSWRQLKCVVQFGGVGDGGDGSSYSSVIISY